MILLQQKRFAVIFGFLILIGGVFFILVWQQLDNQKQNIPDIKQSELITSATSTNEVTTPSSTANRWETPTYLVNVVVTPTSSIKETGMKKMINKYCRMTYVIPEDWTVFGFLGDSQLISPENERKNKEWEVTNRDLIEDAEGDAFLYPHTRSLYFGCHEKTAARTKWPLLKMITIDGLDARVEFETSKMRDGTMATSYQIIVEKGGVTYEILLDKVEYDNLSDEVKRIIQSIEFEK